MVKKRSKHVAMNSAVCSDSVVSHPRPECQPYTENFGVTFRKVDNSTGCPQWAMQLPHYRRCDAHRRRSARSARRQWRMSLRGVGEGVDECLQTFRTNVVYSRSRFWRSKKFSLTAWHLPPSEGRKCLSISTLSTPIELPTQNSAQE